jgi:hypothetical protein
VCYAVCEYEFNLLHATRRSRTCAIGKFLEKLYIATMAAQTQHHLLLLGLLCSAVLLLPSASCQPLEVVSLSDTTFEHQTQAATGQTTGHW